MASNCIDSITDTVPTKKLLNNKNDQQKSLNINMNLNKLVEKQKISMTSANDEKLPSFGHENREFQKNSIVDQENKEQIDWNLDDVKENLSASFANVGRITDNNTFNPNHENKSPDRGNFTSVDHTVTSAYSLSQDRNLRDLNTMSKSGSKSRSKNDLHFISNPRESNRHSNQKTVKLNEKHLYVGEASDESPHGNGYIKSSSTGEIIYEGSFYNGKFDGEGILFNVQSEDILFSNFNIVHDKNTKNPQEVHKKDNALKQKELYSLETYGENWTCYKGMFKEGYKEGFGKFEFDNGNEFESEFEDDKINGFGILRYKDGAKFVGQWNNNLLVKA